MEEGNYNTLKNNYVLKFVRKLSIYTKLKPPTSLPNWIH